ncbi:mitochondrial inner membrane protease subunit 1 isoform X2 [Brachyhypopomus gauderio]|uniref:mitochondrial inner membrane protease subunit 1 isoform X2 n=1 Tax=Brachyhypopomus gauderio TaxID=698409 RepID=UPI00404245D8
MTTALLQEFKEFLLTAEMLHSRMGKFLGFVGYTIQYGCIAHCAFEYVGEFVTCSGPSMEPTITNRDVVFSERISQHLYRIEKGDIVIAKSPFDPKMNICKRVIGLEGDKVCISGPSDSFRTHTYWCQSSVNSLQNEGSIRVQLQPTRYQEVTCGLKEITCRIPQIPGVMVPFPML